MKPVNLSWAQTPYLRSQNDQCGYKALVSFDNYVDKTLFALAKNEWAGYIEKNDKKIAVYGVGVIQTLLTQGYPVILSGVEIKNDKKPYISTDYLLSVSQNSTDDLVSCLANFREQLDKWNKHVKGTVDKLESLFQPAYREDGKHEAENEKWIYFTVGAKEFKIDINNGFDLSIGYDEPSHEHFVAVHYYSKLKPEYTIEQLRQAVDAAQNLPKKPQFSMEAEWCEGYNPETWEPKKNKFGYK